MNDKGARPFGVTIVFLVVVLTGLYAVVVGILRLFNREESPNASLVAALLTIAVGVIYLLVARGIARGSRGARFLVALVTIASILSAVWVLFLSHGLWLSVIVQILLGLIVLALLYTARATMYFAR